VPAGRINPLLSRESNPLDLAHILLVYPVIPIKRRSQMKIKIMLTVGLIAFLAVISGYGQPTTSFSLKAKMAFPFTVEGKVLPAGQYDFVLVDETAPAFRITDEAKNSTLALILTRIAAAMHATPQVPHLVFDKVGDTYLLSEIWIPGQDGFLVQITKGKHEHMVVKTK
jgi:hypothetical protein